MAIDLEMLASVRDWGRDFLDELNRPEVLPCKVDGHMQDCITRQSRYLLEEMKPAKMCIRCQARWHFQMALKLLAEVLGTGKKVEAKTAPDFS
jgi:hypothetical protein